MLGDRELGVTVLRPLRVMPLPHLSNSHCLVSTVGELQRDFFIPMRVFVVQRKNLEVVTYEPKPSASIENTEF